MQAVTKAHEGLRGSARSVTPIDERPGPRDVLVILPTYDEAAAIDRVLRAVRASLPDAHILVADDASPDGTAELARAAGARLGGASVLARPGRSGLGTAYRDGSPRAGASVIEVPVRFVDRREGGTKTSAHTVFEALWHVSGLGLQRRRVGRTRDEKGQLMGRRARLVRAGTPRVGEVSDTSHLKRSQRWLTATAGAALGAWR